MAQSCYGLLNLGIRNTSGDLNPLQPQLCVADWRQGISLNTQERQTVDSTAKKTFRYSNANRADAFK